MSKRRGRRRKKKVPVALIVVAVIVVVIAAGVTIFIQRRNAPTTETVNLDDYYRLAAHSVTNEEGETTEYAAASENEIAIVMDDSVIEERAVMSDGEAYLRYAFVRENIDPRFYYDGINDLIIVTNALQTITANGGSSEYSVDGSGESLAHPISIMDGEELYLSAEFVDKFSAARSALFEEPSRLYLQTKTGDIKMASISKDTQIRAHGGNKSAIVSQIAEGSPVKVGEEVEGWTEVMDEQGFFGYVPSDTLADIHDENVKSDYDEPEYTHIDYGDKINMLWHGVFYFGQDMEIGELAANVKGVNVLSPRWFALDLSEDYVELLSNPEYMTYARENNYTVWAMITDDLLEREDVKGIITDTNKRRIFIDAVMSDAKLEGIDGLNLDFEKINSEFGDDFIQLVREMSIECRKEGIVFSVDNYTPYSYNAAYHIDQQNQVADYIIVMAYDHYVGSDEIGPNSSVDFLEEMMDVTLPQVDETRLVIGLPFYSRFWYNRGGDDITNEVYSMYTAKAVLEEHGIEPKWDDHTGMYAAQFESDGAQVYAWLEDADSIKAKLTFLVNYDIAGVSWWNLGQQTDDVWDVISKYF